MSSGRDSETNYNKIGNWKPWTLEDHGFPFERLLKKQTMFNLFQKPQHKYSKLCSTCTKMYQIPLWKHHRQDNETKSRKYFPRLSPRTTEPNRNLGMGNQNKKHGGGLSAQRSWIYIYIYIYIYISIPPLQRLLC